LGPPRLVMAGLVSLAVNAFKDVVLTKP
jgi:hypothetical protein